MATVATAGVVSLRHLALGSGRHNESGRSKEGGLRCGGRISEDTSEQLFLAGVVHFFHGVLLTKEKVVHTTLCMTYVVKIRPKTPIMFWVEGV